MNGMIAERWGTRFALEPACRLSTRVGVSAKVVGCQRHSPIYGVRLWVSLPMITRFATLQILRKELDANDGSTRITGKEGN